MTNTNKFVPDIPTFVDLGDGIGSKYQEAYTKFKASYRSSLRTRISWFRDNVQSYLAKKPFSGDQNQIVFKKIFKDAQFIQAYPGRYGVGGMNLAHVRQFMLHRPGYDIPSSYLEQIILEFSQKNRDASTHFVAGQDGRLVQMVDLTDIAWHTGVGHNEVSVGVEMEGPVGAPISEQLYRVVASLIARVSLLSADFKIDSDHVVEHRKVLPQSKKDVGEPLQLPKLLELAKQLVQTYNKDDLFKQLSAGDALQVNLDSVMALSTIGGSSGVATTTMQTMSSDTASIQRSTGFATYSRTDISQAASQQSISKAEHTSRTMTFKLNKISGSNGAVTPQTNVLGVLFDFKTGLYNDGGTP